MRRVTTRAGLAFLSLLAVFLLALGPLVESAPRSPVERRAELQKILSDGNYKDAFEGFSALALDPNTNPQSVPQDLQQAVQCLNNLGLVLFFR